MNAKQATALTNGLDATDRRVVINTKEKCIEVWEGSKGDSGVLIRFWIVPATEPSYRERNADALREVHKLTDGGEGREVDPAITRAWKAMGLRDRSVKVSLDGYAL